MQKKTVLRIIILALILIWMITIFNFSNQNGDESSNLSREIASKIVQESEVDKVEPYIRKIAHLSEYAIGGVLFLLLFLTYNFSDIKRMIFSLLLGVEYAAIDEIHQTFVDGRSGQIVDVFIDSIGIALGICILMLIYKITIKIQQKRKDGVLNKQ